MFSFIKYIFMVFIPSLIHADEIPQYTQTEGIKKYTGYIGVLIVLLLCFREGWKIWKERK